MRCLYDGSAGNAQSSDDRLPARMMAGWGLDEEVPSRGQRVLYVGIRILGLAPKWMASITCFTGTKRPGGCRQ